MPEVTESKEIAGVYTVRLAEHADERGRFVETFRQSWIPGARQMIQGNRSDSKAGTLRGLHYHLFQADYWCLVSGSAVAGLYDLRASSPTFKTGTTVELESIGLYIPPGVAHGFYARTDATLTYLVDQYYDSSDEFGLYFDDPNLGIAWPEGERILSDRDRSNLRLAEVPEENRPV